MENSDRHQRYKYEQQQKFKNFGCGNKKTTLESMMTTMVSQKPQQQLPQRVTSNQDDFGSFHQAAQTFSAVQQNPQQMPTNNQVQQQNRDVQTPGNWLQNLACLPIVYHQVYEASVASDGLVDTSRVHQILLQSQLSTHVLGHLWSLANIGIPGRLNQHELYLLLGLIALVQSGDSNPNLQKLAQLQTAPMPIFNLNATAQQQIPHQQEQNQLVRPPQAQQAPVLPPNFQPPPYEPPQVAMTSQPNNVINNNNDDDEFGDFAQFNFNSTRNEMQSPAPARHHLPPPAPQSQIPPTPQVPHPAPQVPTDHQINPTTDLKDDFSDFASPKKPEDTVVPDADDDFNDFAAPAPPQLPAPPKDPRNGALDQQAGSALMTSSAASKGVENQVDKYAAFKDNDEMNLFTSAFAPTTQQQHNVMEAKEQQQQMEEVTNEIGTNEQNDDFDDFGDFSEAPPEDFAAFDDLPQDPVPPDPKVKALAEIANSESQQDRHSVKSLELKNSNKQGEVEENGKEETGRKPTNLHIVASIADDVTIPPANDDVKSATFSPPPFDKFDDFDDDEFGDFPAVQPPAMTSSVGVDVTSSFRGNSSLATFDAFGDDDQQVAASGKPAKFDRHGRQNHSSVKSHFDLSALSIAEEDDKDGRLQFETAEIPEKVEAKEAVSPVDVNSTMMTSQDVVVNSDDVIGGVEQGSVENSTKEETPPKPPVHDVIRSAFNGVTQESSGDHLNEEENNYFELWQRCLQACWEILTLANDVFTSIQSPQVCKEVVYSCRGQRFIQDLSAVHAVSCRIGESYNETFQQGDSRLKVLSTIGKQIDLAWNNILAFCPNTPILETNMKDDESLKSCQICCQQIATNGNLIEFASSNYHSTCANLWVNNVNSILPSLNH